MGGIKDALKVTYNAIEHPEAAHSWWQGPSPSLLHVATSPARRWETRGRLGIAVCADRMPGRIWERVDLGAMEHKSIGNQTSFRFMEQIDFFFSLATAELQENKLKLHTILSFYYFPCSSLLWLPPACCTMTCEGGGRREREGGGGGRGEMLHGSEMGSQA